MANLIDKIVQFLAVAKSGPFSRKGAGLQLFADLLALAFASSSLQFKEKIQNCYKVFFIYLTFFLFSCIF